MGLTRAPIDPIRHAAKLAIVRVTIRDFSVMGCRLNQSLASLRTNRAWEALNEQRLAGCGRIRTVTGGDSAKELMGYPDFCLEVIPIN